MPRAIDHLVLATHDLDGLGRRFEALGFTVGTRNRHPWGTENRIIQFADRSFLELITVGEGAHIPEHAPGHFSFGAFVRDALAAGRTGLIMLALASEDARADAAAFALAGIGDFGPFDFERRGRRPDGSEVHVAFSLAFAASPAMPDCGFFVCQQHFPQNFWSAAMQKHANGATGIGRVAMIAENPSDHHIFLSAYTGSRAMKATSAGLEIALGGGCLEMLTAEAYAARYGRNPGAKADPAFAGLAIRVESFGKLLAAAQNETASLGTCGRNPVVTASDFFNADLLFEEERPP